MWWQQKYSDVEFRYVKCIYHVEPAENSDYVELDSKRWLYLTKSMHNVKAAGLPELTWSDDLYNSTTLLHAKDFLTQI